MLVRLLEVVVTTRERRREGLRRTEEFRICVGQLGEFGDGERLRAVDEVLEDVEIHADSGDGELQQLPVVSDGSLGLTKRVACSIVSGK
jgi:hypothetical protein